MPTSTSVVERKKIAPPLTGGKTKQEHSPLLKAFLKDRNGLLPKEETCCCAATD